VEVEQRRTPALYLPVGWQGRIPPSYSLGFGWLQGLDQTVFGDSSIREEIEVGF
jgi:hypothetical protein